nr:uncharacterized protein LOC129453573 [Misgurnus anguillicaudatus]
MFNCFLKCFNLKIMQLLLYLLIWAQTVDALTDQPTKLGQNVTINCDLDVKEVNWFLLKLPDPPVKILRSMNTGPFHYNITLKQKYFIQSKLQLFIKNVTFDELGVYYCMNTHTTTKLISATRLHINDQIPGCQNKTEVTHFGPTLTQWKIIAIISSLFNAVMLIVVIGLAVALIHKRTRKSTKQFEDIDPQVLMDFEQDSTQIQYVLVDVPTRF